MIYAKLDKSGKAVETNISRRAIRKEFTHIAFSDVDFDDHLPKGFVPVKETQQPKYDPATQVLKDGPIKEQKGEYIQTWIVTDIAADVLAERKSQALKDKRENTVVTMRQARLALLEAGLLKKVADAISAIPNAKQKAAAEIDWEYAVEVRRKSPLIKALAPALGLSNEQIDALFDAAGAIE